MQENCFEKVLFPIFYTILFSETIIQKVIATPSEYFKFFRKAQTWDIAGWLF